MADKTDIVRLIKVPILIALGVTVARAVAEAFGAPTALSMILGVAWLHILFPIYFATKILDLGFDKPFVTLIKTTVMWAVPVRVAVAFTYVLGYVYQIDSLRFQPGSLGPLGEDVTSLQGYLVLPLTNFASWMFAAVLLAVITGGGTLFVKKRMASRPTA